MTWSLGVGSWNLLPADSQRHQRFHALRGIAGGDGDDELSGCQAGERQIEAEPRPFSFRVNRQLGERGAARADFPLRVLGGERIQNFIGGALPLTDADPVRSPPPPDEIWRVGGA